MKKNVLIYAIVILGAFYLIFRLGMKHPVLFVILGLLIVICAVIVFRKKPDGGSGQRSAPERSLQAGDPMGKYAQTSIVRKNHCKICHDVFYAPPNNFCSRCDAKRFHSEERALGEMADYVLRNERLIDPPQPFSDAQLRTWKSVYQVVSCLAYLKELDSLQQRGQQLPRWLDAEFLSSEPDAIREDYALEPAYLKRRVSLSSYMTFRTVDQHYMRTTPCQLLKQMNPSWARSLDLGYPSSYGRSGSTGAAHRTGGRHTDRDGVPDGYSVSGSFGDVHHYDRDGVPDGYSVSDSLGEIHHYDRDGVPDGHSVSDSWGEIHHCDRDGVPNGYSVPDGMGGYYHYDKDGVPIGHSD